MRGQVARRRTAHFGWIYGYESWRIEPGPAIPDFLLRAARARGDAGVVSTASDLVEVLVTDYPARAGIGWHRDAPMFGVVVGVSLGSACRFRFRRAVPPRATCARQCSPRARRTCSTARRARSGSTRSRRARAERYSVTFRTLREAKLVRRLPRSLRRVPGRALRRCPVLGHSGGNR